MDGRTYRVDAKYVKAEVTFQVGRYAADRSLAIQAVSSEGMEATVTVCVDRPPSPGCIWVKDWSENEGWVTELERLGLAERTGATIPTGFVEATEMRLTGDWAGLDERTEV